MHDLLQWGVLPSSYQVTEFQFARFFRSWRTKTSCQATENPNRKLGIQLLVLSDAESGKRRKIGNVSLESCSQILKETRIFKNLMKTENLVKVTKSSPIYRQAPKPVFPQIWRKSFKSLQISHHLHFHHLPAIYKKVQKSSKKTNMSTI